MVGAFVCRISVLNMGRIRGLRVSLGFWDGFAMSGFVAILRATRVRAAHLVVWIGYIWGPVVVALSMSSHVSHVAIINKSVVFFF